MFTSSYLFMSKRKKPKFSQRIMEKQTSSESDISTDSLESNFKKKTSLKNEKCEISDENVDTILVPFYENDVLIKVPKNQKRITIDNAGNKKRSKEVLKRHSQPPSSYLVNKDRQKPKRSSYLERFRQQFAPNSVEVKIDHNDISSLLPEFGDSERESIGEVPNHPVTEFYNTESYNEMYYEKLLNRDLEQYLEHSFEENLHYTDDVNKLPDENLDNLRSVSEVTQPRHRARRATVQPIPNVKLGGLGPDMEKIKPRLERARSLQRYSEKVRMENRLKIYKKSVQEDADKKDNRLTSGRRQESAKRTMKERVDDQSASYLMNKSMNEKKSKVVEKTWSKSADVQRTRERWIEKGQLKEKASQKKNESHQKLKPKTAKEIIKKEDNGVERFNKSKIKTSANGRNKAVNTERGQTDTEVSPVQISFMVNVGGARPSSALKTLEEKHRMYQEQVKAFMENN